MNWEKNVLISISQLILTISSDQIRNSYFLESIYFFLPFFFFCSFDILPFFSFFFNVEFSSSYIEEYLMISCDELKYICS